MPECKATLRSIAALAHVSAMTVSRALRGDRHVQHDTRNRILALACQFGYRANSAATQLCALRVKKSSDFKEYMAILIGRFRRDWEASWKIMSYFKGIHARADQLGFKVLELWLYEPGMTLQKAQQYLEFHNVRGIVILPEYYHEIPEELAPLVAKNFCAVVGSLPINLPVHFAANDDFATAVTATRRALALGYSRPGFAVLRKIDELISRRYSGAFRSVQSDLAEANQIPVCFLDQFDKKQFLPWYRKYRPDVIITHNRRIAVEEWLKPLGLKVPEDCGWISLDVAPGDQQVAGMDPRSEFVGSAALDLVIEQMQREETGIPAFQKGAFIEGIWQTGSTVEDKLPAARSGNGESPPRRSRPRQILSTTPASRSTS